MSDTTNASLRKCYGAAMAILRDSHREEFEALLEAQYQINGLQVRRRLSSEAAAEKRAQQAKEREAKAEAKRQAKIAKLQAELEALAGPQADDISEIARAS